MIKWIRSLVAERKLRTKISELSTTKSSEFCDDLLGLLHGFDMDDLTRFVELWSRVEKEFRTAFIVFVVTGDDPDGSFLDHLAGSVDCQEAVDLAFKVHVGSLREFGRYLALAETGNEPQDA